VIDGNEFARRAAARGIGRSAASEGQLNRDLIPQLEAFVERLTSWRGSLVKVVEQVTRSPGTLDRHFTTTSTQVIRLEFVGITFSGGTLMVQGKAFGRDVGHQATVDLLEHLSLGSDEVVFVERFGAAAERHSIFRRLPEAPDAEHTSTPDTGRDI
jgi:hypothetical protein